MDGSEITTKQNKMSIPLFYFFIPTHPNGSKLGRQEHLHPHCFIQDNHQNHLEGCCQSNLVSKYPLQMGGWIKAILSTVTVAECRAACGIHIPP